MPNRIGITSLNASTLDIINTIRANASAEYQDLVPEITKASEIPKVGEVLYGYPALANQFLSSLINRIALVKVKSAVFNNAYAELKKGYLEFGEAVEEVFVNIAKAREFSAEKAASREFKRTIPDVKTAFHWMNWRVQYPITIQQEDLKRAFTNANGVQDMIAKIIDSIYTAAEYDEYLLFKYMFIKAFNQGKMHVVEGISTTNVAAKAFRGMSNRLTFMSNNFNSAGVTTSTPKSDQYIFMDSLFNAEYDVDELAAAFNMEKADFMGKLMLIDDFTTFDNERFAEIRANSDMIEVVTDEELTNMAGIKAILVDKEWFQFYDNLSQFTDVFVSSGLYWNYNYHVWKTVSYSPFSNVVAFVEGVDEEVNELTLRVAGVTEGAGNRIITFEPVDGVNHVQTSFATTKGIAVHPYGAYIIPDTALSAAGADVASTANAEMPIEVKYHDLPFTVRDFDPHNVVGGEVIVAHLDMKPV